MSVHKVPAVHELISILHPLHTYPTYRSGPVTKGTSIYIYVRTVTSGVFLSCPVQSGLGKDYIYTQRIHVSIMIFIHLIVTYLLTYILTYSVKLKTHQHYSIQIPSIHIYAPCPCPCPCGSYLVYISMSSAGGQGGRQAGRKDSQSAIFTGWHLRISSAVFSSC